MAPWSNIPSSSSSSSSPSPPPSPTRSAFDLSISISDSSDDDQVDADAVVAHQQTRVQEAFLPLRLQLERVFGQLLNAESELSAAATAPESRSFYDELVLVQQLVTHHRLYTEMVRIVNGLNALGASSSISITLPPQLVAMFGRMPEPSPAPPPQPVGLTPDQLALLPLATYQPDLSLGTRTCSICIDDLATGDTVCILPCDHVFHKDCVHPWLSSKPSCPNCRFELAVA